LQLLQNFAPGGFGAPQALQMSMVITSTSVQRSTS
jgi:hypothetical protein